MKITCERDKLQAAYQIAAAVAPSRSPQPILQSVKLEAAGTGSYLLATDLEVGVRVALEGIEVQSPGAVVLPTLTFGPMLRELSDATLRIETDGESILVRGDRSEFRLPSENPDQFPAVGSVAQLSAYHELPARTLKEVVRRTIFATDNESSRYALGGVLLEMSAEKIIAVATDGRRLAKMETAARCVGGHDTSDRTTIVPTKALQLVDKALSEADGDVQIAAQGSEVILRTPQMTIQSRLVEGRFPRWRDVFPQRTGLRRLGCLVGPFHAAVRQAAIATDNDSRGVDFAFSPGSLVITGVASNRGRSKVEFPVPFEGEPLTITLDPRYLSDFLRTLDPARSFDLELKDAQSAAVCYTDDGYGYVIMPLSRDR